MRRQSTAPLWVPLFFHAAAMASAPLNPQGRVLGLAPPTLPHARALSAPIAQASTCTVYFDATGQLTFQLPAPGTALTPAIGPANIIAGGPAFAHGTTALSASAAGHTLSANAAINGVTLTSVNASVATSATPGIAFFATSTGCTAAGNFTVGVQSVPTAPAGQVAATLNSAPTTTIFATYVTSLTEYTGYVCSGISGIPGTVPCNVWAVLLTPSFLTAGFAGQGAGAYTLTIDQVTLTSP